jgi:hypothetical protein
MSHVVCFGYTVLCLILLFTDETIASLQGHPGMPPAQASGTAGHSTEQGVVIIRQAVRQYDSWIHPVL